MAELFPCPNPKCFHWNPSGRKKCFSCQEDLTGVEGGDGGRKAGTAWLIAAAVLVTAAGVGWMVLRPSSSEPSRKKATKSSDGAGTVEGPLEVSKLSAADGSYAANSPFMVTGSASRPIVSVRINGQPGEIEGVTSFTGKVPLVEGANTIEVVVADSDGATQSKKVTVYHHPWALPEGISFAGVNAQGHETYKSAKDDAVLVLVPAGTFRMGADSGDADERPAHSIVLHSYLIDVGPVTNARYRRFAEATGRPGPPAPEYDPTYFDQKPEYPVVNVSWEDAEAYAAWAGRQLPTEAQWEMAARGLAGATYPWGEEVPSETSGHCNLKGAGDGFEQTSPVAHFPKGTSPFGLVDMAGNVWNWTADWHSANAYADSEGEEDPGGPERGSQRVLRGGAFTSGPGDVRSSNRYARSPKDRPSNAGFRTAVPFASGTAASDASP